MTRRMTRTILSRRVSKTARHNSSCRRSTSPADDRLHPVANAWDELRSWLLGHQVSRTADSTVFPRLIDTGSGKTSLIKSIVQLCEDIVHIDPLPTLHSVRRQSTHISSSVSTSAACTEVHASSRPYPKWWNSLDDNRHLKRRKSMGDQVLDRNICFVDTQTQRNTSKLERYMEEQLLKIINCADKSVNDLVGLMTGSGGGQVDLVLYLITPGTYCVELRDRQS